jgi:hypothetical protein
MDYPGVFKRSGRLLRQHKLLWVVGLLLMIGSLPTMIGGHLYLQAFLTLPSRIINAANPQQVLDPIFEFIYQPGVLIGGMVAIFVIFTVVWMASTIGEAALIWAVAGYDDGRSHSLREMLSTGTGLLARFIAIDTVIFLPLFLIFLVQLLIVGGGLIAAIIYLIQPGAVLENLIPVAVIAGLAVVVLLALAVPVAIVTFLIRLIAFRSAALEDLPTRPSIRRAWQVIRRKIWDIIVVFLLLYAVNYGIGILTSFLVAPFSIGGFIFFAGPIMQGQLPPEARINAFSLLIALVSLINVIPTLFYRVFYSAVWTLAYREWQRES